MTTLELANRLEATSLRARALRMSFLGDEKEAARELEAKADLVELGTGQRPGGSVSKLVDEMMNAFKQRRGL